MNRFFVDTFYWIALSNRRDQWHARVRAFDDALTAYRLYTTDEVLTEFLTFYSEGTPHTRRQAALGYPPKPGHFVSSITYRQGLMALPGQGQCIDLR